ncbi:MAG: AtpZ/AtpI family protein [Planctomycetes bacterium]|nr:AtpZ/AtpI family protein [Planctomycetota bacterium]MBM4081514.1 AtpZ/AtpI family protein [Planctomycetota bacterium]
MAESEEQRLKWLRITGLVTNIPIMLAAGPVLGYFLGSWLDSKLGTQPWLVVVLALLGFGAGVNGTIRIIRTLQKYQNDG